ncbi:alginate O-acetyltransferase AlgX-related protein [Candidatus Uabimicrobium amorphum]|uniref:AlgX/AlgJ SGNH hydrolase-like domain-containing protein n=1 Tax=Uabimicrobium amorphum TaxID=2596890 RepID=A0A5S9IM33_UABAM|nr:SGNH/GDSL hydrolase family protein [Candidatus Uabimicrobium amorphum]BBM84027.1 hypothetical protein UABAM_02382 [Candidatus Uabimicrobium amorphum]
MNRKTAVIASAMLLVINLFMWFVPSNVVRMIAINKKVLLGYYSVGRLTGNVIVLLVSFIVLYIVWSRTREILKKRCFRVCAVILGLIPCVIATDVVLRVMSSQRYVGKNEIYHRPPNYHYEEFHEDIPEQKRGYARVEKGYPGYQLTVSIDEKGFRNPKALEQSHFVLVGDSFTEGSGVSDDQVWGRLLEKKTNKSLCNFGMSGSDPLNYLITLQKFAIHLRPKTVICTIYEGNDFRRTQIFTEVKDSMSLGQRIKWIFKGPLRSHIKSFLIKHSEGINTNTSFGDHSAISWLPLEYPIRSNVFYSFPVKRVMEHYVSLDGLKKSGAAQNVQSAILKMQEFCTQNKARFILVFAPAKPHVLLPVAKDEIPVKDFHDFCMLHKRKMRKKLPSEVFFAKILQCLEYKEQLIGEFCKKNKIEFVSLTKALQEATKEGKQTYFTYDQHWTPLGNVIAAERIHQYLQESE